MRRVLVFLSLALSLALSGCLSTTHIIPKGDLVKLAQTPAEQRAERVRVVQGFLGSDEPPTAPHVGVGTEVVIVSPGRPHAPSVAGGVGEGIAKSKNKDAKAWLVLAAITAVVLAGTEGARFDGWVRLHPMHPVHLYGADGTYTWVPLAQLDPQTAMWAAKAFVREEEGPWQRLERAPLDRAGWTYAMLLGGAHIPARDGSTPVGFMGHIQIGHFPMHQVGVLLDIALGGSDDLVGNVVADTRYQAELELLPLSANPFHAGVYGDLGVGYRFEDGSFAGESAGVTMGGGVMLQLELTTRLAITARAGIQRAYAQTTDEALIGLSIY